MLMPDPRAALSEARRVLRPAGNLAFSVFAAPEANPFVDVPRRVFLELGHLPSPPPDAPGVFALSDPTRIRGLLGMAGFEVQTIDAIDIDSSFPSAESIVERILEMNVAVGPIHRGLPEHDQAEAVDAMIDEFADYRKPDGTYVLPAQMWGVHAR